MDAVFERILQISISGGVIVLAVLVLRCLLHRAPKRTVCLLWMIAVLRLLVPFEIESDWSLQPDPVVEFVPPTQVEHIASSDTVQGMIPPEYPDNAVEHPMPERLRQEEPARILPWIWLSGVAVLTVHGAACYFHLKRRVRDAVILEEGVWISPGLDTAFVLGYFHPRVYMPVLSGTERELMLRHERCHIRRLDHWWKLLAYAAVAVHWFNPLAWVTYVLLCRDMELACDQETVKDMDNEKRKAYAATLLNCAVKRSGIAACPVAFGEISVKERIKMVLNYKKPGFWVTGIALIAAAAVGVCLLTSPKTLTELNKCEQGLMQWQEMKTYELHDSSSSVGNFALDHWSECTYLSLDGERLMRHEYGDGIGCWKHWKNGTAYIHEFGSLDAGWEDCGWQEGSFQEAETIHWAMDLRWEDLTVHHCESADGGKTVQLAVEHRTLGPGTMNFCFDDAGALRSISRTFTIGNDEGLSSVCTDTVELRNRSRDFIEQIYEQYGVKPELYREECTDDHYDTQNRIVRPSS